MRTIVIAALNVVLPEPHRAEKYRELWMKAFEMKIPVKLRADTGGVIGSANTGDEQKGRPIWGDLYKFVNIEMDGRWLDIRTRKAANKDTVARQVQIPPNLHPNMRSVPYVFFPSTHRLIFVSRLDSKNAISPGMARTLVIETFRHGDLVKDFGLPEVTIEPDRETLKRIFDLPRLKRLYIEVTPPNALGDIERKLFERLNGMNAGRMSQTLSSAHPEGLRVDQDTKNLAEVAKSNGFVEGKGEDARGRTRDLSTLDHPHTEKHEVDPKIQVPRDVLMAEAPRISAKLSQRDEPIA